MVDSGYVPPLLSFYYQILFWMVYLEYYSLAYLGVGLNFWFKIIVIPFMYIYVISIFPHHQYIDLGTASKESVFYYRLVWNLLWNI